ncbi:MAG: DNA polymerase III subunit delta [Pirellulales bacterium]
MPATLEALPFLAKPEKYPADPVCVLFGDDPFLKRLALAELRREVLGSDDGEFSLARFNGRQAAPREVFDELSTVALFGGGRRLVVVDDADDFVSAYRPELEDYVARPRGGGVLVLVVSTWPKTTRLYKTLADCGLQIDCKAPARAALLKWLAVWSQRTHRAKLDPAAAEVLVDLVGPELGLLDQELAKLAVSAGTDQVILPELVADLVGGWRARTTWDMLDAAVSGDARAALSQLDRLLLGGENPVGLLAQMASSLKRFASAARIVEQAEAEGQRVGVRQALEQAGVKTFVLAKAEPQLKQLGRRRASQLHRWLLDADMALKGESRLPPRTVLEKLIVRLSKAAAQSG